MSDMLSKEEINFLKTVNELELFDYEVRAFNAKHLRLISKSYITVGYKRITNKDKLRTLTQDLQMCSETNICYRDGCVVLLTENGIAKIEQYDEQQRMIKMQEDILANTEQIKRNVSDIHKGGKITLGFSIAMIVVGALTLFASILALLLQKQP